MSAIDLDRIKDQGKNFVDGFTPGQKAMTILGVIAVVLASMAFSRWSSSTDYAPLYANLSGADAGKVTQALDSAGVKWKLTDGGATVLVPSSEVYKQRVALSADGLPSNNDGLALLDKEGITASEFVQRVDYQRAMQGELEKTINAIDGISATTVNLTIPPDQVFAGATADKPSAAVLVQPAGGTKVSSDTVQAIVHLVASSIPNLTPDDRDRRRLQRQRAQRAGHGHLERPGSRAAVRLRHDARRVGVVVPRLRARAEPRATCTCSRS